MTSVKQHHDADRLARAAAGLPIDVHDEAIVSAYEQRANPGEHARRKRATKTKASSSS